MEEEKRGSKSYKQQRLRMKKILTAHRFGVQEMGYLGEEGEKKGGGGEDGSGGSQFFLHTVKKEGRGPVRKLEAYLLLTR